MAHLLRFINMLERNALVRIVESFRWPATVRAAKEIFIFIVIHIIYRVFPGFFRSLG